MVIEDLINLISDAMEKKKEEDKSYQSFSEWLKINKKYFLFILSILPLALEPLAMKCYEKFFGKTGNWMGDNHLFIAITAALQCLFILFAIFLPVNEMRFLAARDKDKESALGNDEKKANTALMQFKSAWTFLWTSWFLLYLTLFIKYFPQSKHSTSAFDGILQVFMNFFNNSTPAVFVICYLIFATITVPDKDSPESYKTSPKRGNKSNAFHLNWAIGLSLIFLLLLGIFDFRFQGNGITKWVSSILAGIAMAFFLGRLNNKFINPSIFIIVCLYAYMAIQTLFPFWSGIHDDFIILLSANLAFIFKIVLYLFMLWLFRSGRLLFYLKNERKLIQSVDKDWDKFKSSGVFITPPLIKNTPQEES